MSPSAENVVALFVRRSGGGRSTPIARFMTETNESSQASETGAAAPVGERRDATRVSGMDARRRFASSRLRSRRVGSLGARRASIPGHVEHDEDLRAVAPVRRLRAGHDRLCGGDRDQKADEAEQHEIDDEPRRPAGDRPSDEAHSPRDGGRRRAPDGKPTSRPNAAASGVRKLTDTSRSASEPRCPRSTSPSRGSGA